MSQVAYAQAYVLGALLLVAGVSKFRLSAEGRAGVALTQLIAQLRPQKAAGRGPWRSVSVLRAVGVMECGAGLALLAVPASRVPGAVAVAMFAGGAAYLTVARIRVPEATCGCVGMGRPISRLALARSTLLVVPGLVILTDASAPWDLIGLAVVLMGAASLAAESGGAGLLSAARYHVFRRRTYASLEASSLLRQAFAAAKSPNGWSINDQWKEGEALVVAFERNGQPTNVEPGADTSTLVAAARLQWRHGGPMRVVQIREVGAMATVVSAWQAPVLPMTAPADEPAYVVAGA